MEIRVRLFSPYKEMVGNEGWVAVTLDGETAPARLVLQELVRQYPKLSGQLPIEPEATGEYGPIALILADRIIGLDDPLRPGDCLQIVPGLVGG